MLIVCFYIISYLEGEQNHYENELSGSQCGTSVDASAANLDFLAVSNARTGDFHCFCKIMLDTKGSKALESFQFPFDGGTHCN